MPSTFVQCSQLVLASYLFVTGAKAACSADNCYRALFPCASPSAVSAASSFCATATAGGVTATNFPTRATAACGTTPDRYVSACQCGPTCSGFVTSTTTSSSAACSPTPTRGFIYGDFECGIDPWTAQVPDPAATTAISSPGFTGNKAFEVDFHPPSVSPQLGVSARLLSQVTVAKPGQLYKLTFATYFDNGDAGFIGVSLNNRSGATIDARDFGFGHWHFNQLAFTSTPANFQTTIKYEFIFGETSSVDKVDSIVFTHISSWIGTPAPVGLLPDGEFEGGLGAWTVQVPDPAATADVKFGVGYIGSGAFEVDFQTPPISPQQGVSARVISPSLPVTAGTSYYLQFYSFFDNLNAGFIGVLINGNPVYTVDATDKGAGAYHINDVTWVAPAGVTAATISFEFLFSPGQSSVDRIDSVVFQAFNP